MTTKQSPSALPPIFQREMQAICDRWVKKLAEDPDNPIVQAAMLSIDRLMGFIDYQQRIMENMLNPEGEDYCTAPPHP